MSNVKSWRVAGAAARPGRLGEPGIVAMGPLDGVWHLLNFVAPALGVALIATALAKLLWRRSLKTVPFRPLFTWTAAWGTGVLVAGLLLFGQDGRVVTYAALVVATAGVLWWRGLRRGG